MTDTGGPVRAREAHLSYVLMISVAGLVIFAAVYALLQQPMSMMETYATDQTSSTAAGTGIGYVMDYWRALPLLILGLFAFNVIWKAANEKPGRRR